MFRAHPSRPLGATLILSLMLFLAACSSSAATPSPTAAPPTQAPASAPSSAAPSGGGGGTAGASVSIIDFGFKPADLTAKVGQEITWTNTGNAAHTVTFNTGGIDSGSMSSGKTFKHTFDTPGTYTYHCNFHSSMEATITITQ